MLSTKFIQRSNEYNKRENHVPAPLIRKVFSLEKISKNSIINICGLGFYELYINGENITKGILAPYISNPNQFMYYDSYNISKYLKVGKNVIGIILGNGFLNCDDGGVWDYTLAPYRDAPKVALSFEVDNKVIFECDETFKTHDSPIIYDDYRTGEEYDARKEIKGWNLADFDDSKWDNGKIAKTPLGQAKFNTAEPIKIVEEIKPIDIKKCSDGYIYIFENFDAGICKLKISGKRGQKVELSHGEVIANGDLSLRGLKFVDRSSDRMHKDVYILKGEGVEEYTPRFTYHGFGYVKVTGILESQATLDLLTFEVAHSDIKKIGEFRCSDEIINKIQECIVRSDLGNFYYFPTDCPQREKNGWTADAHLSIEQMALNFDITKSIKQWLENIRISQKESGAVPCIIPTSTWGYTWGSGPAWDIVIAVIPYYMYKYTADKSFILDNLDTIIKYLKYIKNKVQDNGLIECGLGDWAQPNWAMSKPEVPLDFTATIAIINALQKTQKMMHVVNKLDGYDFCNNFEKDLKNALRKKYFENGKLKGEFASQSALSFSIFYNIYNDEKEKKNILEQLVENIEKKSEHFDTGVIGGRVIYNVLADNGYADLAYRMITNKTYPSYAEQVSHGTGTLWESFKIVKGDLTSQTDDDFPSLNHHFWGFVSGWFYTELAGIQINPNLDDIYQIKIAPKYVKNIDFVHAKYNYLGEEICVDWKRKSDGEIDLKIKAPSKFKIIKE